MKKARKVILKTIIAIAIVVLVSLAVLIISAVRYNGLWNMKGYGFCLDMKYGVMKAYEVTSSYSTRAKEYDGYVINGVLYCGLGKFKLNLEEKKLQLMDQGAQYIYSSDPMDELEFKQLHRIKEYDPPAMFEMFYESYQENYAFSELYHVDIAAEYAALKPYVNRQTSKDELYELMCKMVSKLKDGHVVISLTDKEFIAGHHFLPEWIENKEQKALLGKVITEGYVKDYYKFEDCYIRYGTLREDIGYVLIHGLGMEELNKSASTSKAMNQIIEQFEAKGTVVIDLRFCGGGFDEAALKIAGYFTREPYLAYKKQVYHKGEFAPLQDIYVEPGKRYYDGNIVILTSGYTVSAAEILIRAMLANQNPRIILVGEETAGYYSDGVPKVLPGGLVFTMSSERYLWYEDTILEGKGIVPQVTIPIDMDKAILGKDQALDWVLENY